MNLFKLGWSSWILILNIILLLTLIVQLSRFGGKQFDRFVNYAQQVDPTKMVKADPEATAANNNYASILMYLQKNPSKSAKFITDVKDKFFSDSCTVKNDIDFAGLAKMPFGMPFSS